ncbi:MAG: FAD binding domain-containing protein [Chloroflexota bacterium]
MIPAAFDYAAPSSLDEAIGILHEHPDEAKLMAGGHSLLPLMKLRLAAPELIVDLRRIPNLSYIRDHGDHVAIGPMTIHYKLNTSELLKKRLPLLAQAAGMVGDMQVRNRGTIGGSLAHGDPASDLPTVATALGATVVAQGPNGQRSIDSNDFFQDIWTTSLREDEIITEIRIPYGRGEPAQDYQKFRMRAADWAMVGVAVDVRRSNGSIEQASVVMTNVGPTPMRARGVEEALRGQPADKDTIAQAAERAADGLTPTAELRASPEYKKHLANVMTRRALAAALGL